MHPSESAAIQVANASVHGPAKSAAIQCPPRSLLPLTVLDGLVLDGDRRAIVSLIPVSVKKHSAG